MQIIISLTRTSCEFIKIAWKLNVQEMLEIDMFCEFYPEPCKVLEPFCLDSGNIFPDWNLFPLWLSLAHTFQQ